MNTVCMDCPNKGCGAYHDKCEAYKQERAKNAAINKQIRRDNYIDSYVTMKTGEARTRKYFRGRR